MSMVTPLLILVSTGWAIYIQFQTDSNGDPMQFLSPIFVYLVQSFYIQRLTIRQSGNAIRFIDPSWNKVPRDEYLYPTVLYWVGLVDRFPSAFDEKEEDGGLLPSIDDIRTDIEDVFDELDIS